MDVVCTCKQEDDLFLGTVLDRHLGDACLDLVDGSQGSRGRGGIVVILDPRSPGGSGERGEVITDRNILMDDVTACRGGVAVVVDMVRMVVVGLGVGNREILLQIAFAVEECLVFGQVMALWLLVVVRVRHQGRDRAGSGSGDGGSGDSRNGGWCRVVVGVMPRVVVVVVVASGGRVRRV